MTRFTDDLTDAVNFLLKSPNGGLQFVEAPPIGKAQRMKAVQRALQPAIDVPFRVVPDDRQLEGGEE